MNKPHRIPSLHIRSIALDIVLSVLTCMLYNIYWQYKQMGAINAMIKQEKYSFSIWLILTLITCGLYHIYHEYRKSQDIDRALGRTNSNEPLVMVLLTVLGLSIVADAIQQSSINSYFGDHGL